ncbi:hypothetical protein [Coraliomargarita akajimensis]|uniref:Tetratricopeptide TPR_2 repeat protein n=1 Tax=Coraliomargarita akajimensis (strain DSM 45221 / IAM 15411 / JCM 23193 / KCTC 12865 / 04OKA010-24) TaxID=583355 RepID=D5EP13_CORAD|nr:hypothetical protein [Coraliomargarita akajimensis]ADE55523.1 Tetratricopeptide TPR_2 repeat protein [Coraliomargarita akajimensis DSM 45221]
MSRDKKPAVYVAIALGALIVLPFVLLLLSKLTSRSSVGVLPQSVAVESVADYELREMARLAETLLNRDLADATREGDIELNQVMELKKEYDRANRALADGDASKASKRFALLIQEIEQLLSGVEIAESARLMNDQIIEQLRQQDYLKEVFPESFQEATDHYNEGYRQLLAQDYPGAMNGFEMTAALLGDLEARGLQHIQTLIEKGNQALAHYELSAARSAFEAVLRLQPQQLSAQEGLKRVDSLAGIENEVRELVKIEATEDWEAAIQLVEGMLQTHPGNGFLEEKRAGYQARIDEREFKRLLDKAGEAEGQGNYAAAIEALEAALAVKSDAEQAARLEDLRAKYKAARLEVLLTQGFAALKAGQYTAARDRYKEAVALAPESKEARTGYEKASALHLASIRYTQNLEDAEKYTKQGRYPLAAKFFNKAMAARPNVVTAALKAKEATIREQLDAQSQEVSVRILSDKRTYVSLIGVFPPERMKSRELKLFPDVYKLKGTRPGYRTVEVEVRVDGTKPEQEFMVKCTERQ